MTFKPGVTAYISAVNRPSALTSLASSAVSAPVLDPTQPPKAPAHRTSPVKMIIHSFRFYGNFRRACYQNNWVCGPPQRRSRHPECTRGAPFTQPWHPQSLLPFPFFSLLAGRRERPAAEADYLPDQLARGGAYHTPRPLINHPARRAMSGQMVGGRSPVRRRLAAATAETHANLALTDTTVFRQSLV